MGQLLQYKVVLSNLLSQDHGGSTLPYLPPGRINDFAQSTDPVQLAKAWHARVREQIDDYRALARFLDPLDADDTAVREQIPWTGFPRLFDALLDVDGNPDLLVRSRRLNRAHRSAEILNRYVWVLFQDNGQFYQVPPDTNQGWLVYPELNGKPSFADGFSFAERPQDEYLEWFVVRDPQTGHIVRIDFTAEAPEYWETLAEGDPDLAAQLYSDLLERPVPKEDLFFQGDLWCAVIESNNMGYATVGFKRLAPDSGQFQAGQYNRQNRWNTDLGAVHLTQRNNTLFAEINLAANATQRFAARPDLMTETNRFQLTACGGYGALNRNSDPTIGLAVNTLALAGYRVMVSDPIGLYIGEVDVTGFRDPQGDMVDSDRILKVHRGSFSDEDSLPRVLRFSIHPPLDADYGLESCTFNGHPLTTGGPVARQTTLVIHGVAMAADSEHQLTQCLAEACAHPTRKPQYFQAVQLGQSCPDPNDSSWNPSTVTLAPESPPMIAMAGAPRTSGDRSV